MTCKPIPPTSRVPARCRCNRYLAPSTHNQVSETIKILSDDDARDLMSKTTTSFLQTNSGEKSLRAKASSVLRSVGKKTNSMQLLALSSTVKLDGFVKVKAAIEEMVTDLKKQQADEVQQRDFYGTTTVEIRP